MSSRRNFFRLRSLPAGRLLAVLADVVGDLSVLEAAGAGLTIETLGTARLHLPHPDHSPRDLRGRLDAAIDRVAAAMLSKGEVVFDRRAAGSAPLDGDSLLPLGLAAPVLLTVDAASVAYDETAEPATRMLALVGGDEDAWTGIARDVTDLVRLTRDVRLVGGPAVDGVRFALTLDAAASRGARLDALLASDRLAHTRLFEIHETEGGALPLPQGIRPGRRQLALAARVAQGLPGSQAPVATIYDPDRGGVSVYRIETPAHDGPRTLAAGDPGGGAIRLTLHDIRDNAAALARLQEEVLAHDFPVGYHVRLERLPEWAFRGESVELLQAQIDELEARIAMLGGLEAQQTTLLRFAPGQVGAMIDALRRAPRGRADPREIGYAYAHQADPAARAHFLLCEPDAAVDLLRFSEEKWHQTAGDRPMVYWIDPVWARHQAGEPDSRAQVFVPRHMTLSPSLATFGSDIGGTLRAVMGDLFLDAEAHDSPEAAPLYVFSPGAQPGEMAVEVLDRSAFGPIELRLKWINSHLQLRPPQVVDEAALESVAADLYEGWAAERIAEETAALVDDAATMFEGLNAGIEDGLATLSDALAAEIAAASDRVTAAFDYLREVEQRLTDIETLMIDAAGIVGEQEDAVRDLAELPDDLAALRTGLRDRLLKEFRRADDLAEAAEDRLDRHRAHIERLRETAARML